ncbi:UDP-N-acetylglucosamine pyrophosphorylase [Propionibacteriaceae bacterium Y1923]|uniref:UDP-N-acetylglucosamine pyrophosphorylase n=1 Tax=Aestuariimicrobium sp. Y1814 TaxID=3418742 RepID=UPI003C13B8BB
MSHASTGGLPLPRGAAKVADLIERGATIPNPWTVDIDDDVDVNLIGSNVTIHPGTRIRGARTVISPGCVLGAEGPVTLENCQLGPKVRLEAGYFSGAVFLEGASMGLGAHVRPGTLLEEHASGAHTVGLKQTILFPYATLGSLINFCDAMLTGGTGPKDHSEVGSSYIHFNFTPDGDKTTASLFGDVPRGVLVDQPPIFLGGQGGAVGPVRTGFGVVVGAGAVLRDDIDEDGVLVLPDQVAGLRRPNRRHRYRRLNLLLEKNLGYIASLVALENWYTQVRSLFFAKQGFGAEVLAGALGVLESGRDERVKRVKALVAKIDPEDDARRELVENADALVAGAGSLSAPGPGEVVEYLAAQAEQGAGYLAAIGSLDESQKAAVTAWLSEVIDQVCRRAAGAAPLLGLFTGSSD